MKHSLTNRLIVGVLIGFITGGIVFFGSPFFGITFNYHFGFGLWIFYVLMGMLTGFLGLFNHHPILKFPTPFWLRGIVIGTLMHLMLLFLAYVQIYQIVNSITFLNFQSPYWILLDGVILGIFMSWLEAKLAGEGKLPLK